MKEVKRQIIENYVQAYNEFDIESMIKHFDKNITFQNISNGNVDLEINGIDEFEMQAESAKTIFSERTQTITSWEIIEDVYTIGIHYIGVIAKDLPQGVSAGDTLELHGKSEFTFAGEKIISLKDFS
ncbi:MAG: hypothetical protein P1U56_16060 [Saprospiraceae bacterium]|nr:hypothetical protein [Saprospiraceae bacterium]